MVEQITDNGLIIAIIVKAGFKKNGITFFTPNEFSQQLGYMHHPPGYKIGAHTHKKIVQDVNLTHEVLFIRSGKVKIDLYTNDYFFMGSYFLLAGDVILLATGGHAIEMLEDSEIIEIKQGPYSEDEKINFIPKDK